MVELRWTKYIDTIIIINAVIVVPINTTVHCKTHHLTLLGNRLRFRLCDGLLFFLHGQTLSEFTEYPVCVCVCVCVLVKARQNKCMSVGYPIATTRPSFPNRRLTS